jgi:peptide/nickel transport system substrate-binding protein
MGQPAARVTPDEALDRFFDHYYRVRPVQATFTGVHDYDHRLPDWSLEGLESQLAEMRDLRTLLAAVGGPSAFAEATADQKAPPLHARKWKDEVDLALADGFLEIQIAEHESSHFVHRNPALWTGEAIFSVIALVTRPFAPVEVRLDTAIARMRAIPSFLASARHVMLAAPAFWRARAVRECSAAVPLLRESLPRWWRASGAPEQTVNAADRAALDATAAFESFGQWIQQELAEAPASMSSAGSDLLDLLLRRGHWCNTPPATLLQEARETLEAEVAELVRQAHPHGGWASVQEQLGNGHPSREEYLSRFTRIWERCREVAVAEGLVTWPDAPIRYVPIPEHTRNAAPHLYYLFYRSPAPFDRLPVHDYVVTPIGEDLPPDEQARRLRAANDSAIKLNHVVHHGALGHHVQNAFAYRSACRIGQIAAVDGANRIGMFSGGSLAEGWACYACDVMEEVGFLTPLESIAQQHTRVRILTRAVADLELHSGRRTLEDTAALYQQRASMPSEAAQSEAVKNSMFPGAALMYWLGTRYLHELRRASEARAGSTFRLGQFHDRLLAYGAIPVPLIARLMAALLLACAVLTAACAPRSPGTMPSNDLLIVGYDREPDTLNRFSTHILEDIQTAVVEGLTITDEKMNILPLLASEVPTVENGGVTLRSDGGMDVTWRLRPGITWHDGKPFTSADVKFTVDAINDPGYNPESTDGFDRISSVDTPDPLTAVVHYREVYAPYALQFVRGCLPRHVLQGRDIDRANDYNRALLGTGPYRVAEWKTGEYILLERVDAYWRGTPKIAKLLFKFLPNTNTRINQLKTGEVHVVATVPWDKYREIADVPGLVVRRTPGNAYEHVTLNQRQFQVFADVRVRRALTHAVDRDLIVRTILDGLAPVTHGPIQPVSWAYTDAVTQYAFDPSRARALLDEAGWRLRAGDAIRTRDGQRLAFTLITQAGFVVRESVAQVLQRQFRDVGVDMAIQLHDGTSISQRWFQGNFDAMLHWWQMPADPELTLFFAADRTPPAGRNINFVNDDRLTRLVYAADRTVKRDERKRFLADAQARIAELAIEIPLYGVTKLDAVPATLYGFKGNPTNAGMFWNVGEWEIR